MKKHVVVTSLLLNTCLFGGAAVAGTNPGYGQVLAALDSGKLIVTERSLLSQARNGDSNAQLALAKMYEGNRDDERTAKWYIRSANNGNAEAQFQLGLLYIDGELVEEDPETGLDWLRMAAAQGHVSAQMVHESLKNEDFFIGC